MGYINRKDYIKWKCDLYSCLLPNEADGWSMPLPDLYPVLGEEAKGVMLKPSVETFIDEASPRQLGEKLAFYYIFRDRGPHFDMLSEDVKKRRTQIMCKKHRIKYEDDQNDPLLYVEDLISTLIKKGPNVLREIYRRELKKGCREMFSLIDDEVKVEKEINDLNYEIDVSSGNFYLRRPL